MPARHLAASEEMGGAVDDFLTRMSGFGYSGNVLLIVDGKAVLRKGYGLANRARGEPYVPQTIFDIGSMAKTFTGAAIMKLEAAGKLHTGDAIGGILPEVPQDKRAITIHQLLTHTAGVVTDFPFKDPMTPYEDVARDEAVSRILAAPLDYPPGMDKAYSNGGYILLAAIIERASGQPFRDYMREAILTPAGLRDTGFWGDPHLERSRVALGYNEYGELQHDPMSRSPTTWCDLGGGQMMSTLDDLARWLAAMERGDILAPEDIKRVWTPWTKDLSSRDGDYGYGWFLSKTDRATRLIQHGGDYLGTGAQLQWYADERVVMITSTNVRHDLFPTRNRTDRVIPKIVFGGEHPHPPAWVENQPLLRSVVGEYALPTGGVLVVHERAGRFYIGARGQDAVDLLMPASEDTAGRRARLTATCRSAFDAMRAGNNREFASASGLPKAGAEFAEAVRREIDALARGKWLHTEILGTFASGYPRGNPLDYETTLLRLVFEKGESMYTVRWANDRIAATDVPTFTAAAETPIQANAEGDLVTWNIVFSTGTRFAPRRVDSRVTSLVIHAQNSSVTAEACRRD
jgi:CubicO group peptidase (beta-lactamase class C family)